MSGGTLRCLVLAALCVLAPPGVEGQAEGNPNQQAILTEFNKALADFKQGKYEDAAASLDKILAMKPDANTAIAMRDKLGFKALFEMQRKEEMKPLAPKAEALLELAKKAISSKRADTKAIKQMAANLASDPIARWQAIYELSAIGDTAVPYVLDSLSSAQLKRYEEADKRMSVKSAAVITLRRMRRRAVLPLIQALKCTDFPVRQTAAILLGESKDRRAVPALKALLDSTDEDSRIQMSAAEALAQITGQSPDSLPPAEELFCREAALYTQHDPSVLGYIFEPMVPLWQFDPEGKTPAEQIVHARVPAYTYTFEMAQSACIDGFRVNQDYERLGTAMVASCFEMETRLQSLDQSQGKGGHGEQVLGYTPKEAKSRTQRMTMLHVMAMVAGKELLYSVLHSALGGDAQEATGSLQKQIEAASPSVALAVIAALARLTDDTPETEASPLAHALTSPFVKVRFESARALIEISPSGRMLPDDAVRDRVITVIAAALTELSRPAVLVVDHDPKVRTQLRDRLSELGYTPVSAGDGQTCRRLAAKSYPRISLILIADDLKGYGAQPLGVTLKGDMTTRHIPLLLLTSPRKGERAAPKLAAYTGAVAKTLDAAALQKKLTQVIGKDPTAKAARARAETTVRDALTAIALVDPKTTLYPVGRLVPALTELLLPGRPKDIRLSAAGVLSHMGDRRAMDPMLTVFDNVKEPKTLRLVAAQAIGRMLLDGGEVLTRTEFETLVRALSDKDRLIQIAASRALGRGAPIASASMAILRKHRIR